MKSRQKNLSDNIQYYTSDVVALKDLTVENRLDAVITADIVGFEAQLKMDLKLKKSAIHYGWNNHQSR